MVRGDDPLAEFFRVGLGHLDLRDGGPITRLPSTGNPSPRLDQLGSGRLYRQLQAHSPRSTPLETGLAERACSWPVREKDARKEDRHGCPRRSGRQRLVGVS